MNEAHRKRWELFRIFSETRLYEIERRKKQLLEELDSLERDLEFHSGRIAFITKHLAQKESST